MTSSKLKHIITILAVLYCILATDSHFDSQTTALAEDSNAAPSGFRAHLIAADNEQDLFVKWGTQQDNTKPNDTQTITAIKPLNLYIIYGGCKSDNTGDCDISIKAKVLDPDNEIYSETPKMKIWHNKTPDTPKQLLLEPNHFRLLIELPPKPGHYTVDTQLSDNNAHITLKLKKAFSIGSQTTTPSTTGKKGN